MGAIEAVALQKKRVLVVQKTGWGKSMVYFLATIILRQKVIAFIPIVNSLLLEILQKH